MQFELDNYFKYIFIYAGHSKNTEEPIRWTGNN